ncbi:hypothetical protein GQ43DRAFT_377250 [Delitschia confertaspora ATCC 74209]|uniref:Cora-domain-containing protein n=1 Tax=Delitschia confertaspora ATCC 74209 TaxID=1513339 RepID=A0A9P4JM67_9PLEO|nr:hypothetical protein GQ43DRAFT_377250 [Delitschia confertaspora ATCC 74209]
MEENLQPTSNPDGLPAYYINLDDKEIVSSFRNFDEERHFELFDREVRNPSSRNFVIDFGEDSAFCAFDLRSDSIARLIQTPRPPSLHTRWINIWIPYDQKDTLHALARNYDFSPRLLALMCSNPVPPKPKKDLRRRKSESTLKFSKTSNRSQRSSQGSGPKHGSRLDSEESVGMEELMESTQMELVRDTSHYHIVDEVWHWSSVDWGRRFVCLGYNSLHGVRTNKADLGHEDLDERQDVPHGKRVWSWLLLCDDKTVISISEDPFPFHDTQLRSHELRTLYTIRRNIINVFRQLSKAPTPLHDTSMVMLPIRNRIGNSELETVHRSTDSPGLLFYYLFEDWYTTYSLVTRRDHGYASELDRLRAEMLVQADLHHVDQLHHIGCQLAVLKRVYKSYELIIERVLKKQEATLASLKNSHIMSGFASGENSLEVSQEPQLPSLGAQIPETDSLLGVSLSSAARVRFERLKDRILLYALSEIQECIDQKDSLVMMNFNLIAIKESFAVERLTRVTLLVAKVTMLFMPVSLLTAYFSIQFVNTTFSIKSYWIAFGVVLGLSVGGLMLFSAVSGTMEGRMMYRPLTRIVYDFSMRVLWRRKRKVY